jgi:hypothetical protein
LCNILAFWCGPDDARIDSLFRSSALMRDKWDSPRGETTYGGYTINRALEGRTEFYGQKKTAPTRSEQIDHDSPAMSYAEEISAIFGITEDPIVHGWRSSRKATARVVFTTASGAELELDSWKAATGQGSTLAQEIGTQLGVEVQIKAEQVRRLNVLVGKFCETLAITTSRDRAFELGLTYLQEAETVSVDMTDQASRWAAFRLMHERNPMARARAENTSLAAAGLVLVDATGKRYVRIQWFTDFVKAHAVAGTAGTLLDHLEEPGNWNRIQNTQSRMKATNPETKEQIWQVLFEVPANWGGDDK